MMIAMSLKPLPRGESACPLCMRGAIAPMPMMESLACSFCNHIFVVEADPRLNLQVLKMADTISTLRWVWTGQCWENANAVQVFTSRWLSVLGILLVILPTAIATAAVYYFPVEPDVPLAWFPKFWAIATFFGHLIVFLSITRDYTQFPIQAYWQALQRFARR